jgi:hypothetical protein
MRARLKDTAKRSAPLRRRLCSCKSVSAVPDRTFDPGLPDSAGVSFALGGRLALSRLTHVALSYTHFVFLPRDVHGGLAQFSSPSQSPDASGHYTQQVGLGNLNADLAF